MKAHISWVDETMEAFRKIISQKNYHASHVNEHILYKYIESSKVFFSFLGMNLLRVIINFSMSNIVMVLLAYIKRYYH